jgi:hypothetical protein
VNEPREGSHCGSQCWGCSRRIGGVHKTPLAEKPNVLPCEPEHGWSPYVDGLGAIQRFFEGLAS